MEQALITNATPLELVRAASAAVGLIMCILMTSATWRYARTRHGFEGRVQRFRVMIEVAGCLAQLGFLVAACTAAVAPNPPATRSVAMLNGTIYLLVQNCVTLASAFGSITRRADREWRDANRIDVYEQHRGGPHGRQA